MVFGLIVLLGFNYVGCFWSPRDFWGSNVPIVFLPRHEGLRLTADMVPVFVAALDCLDGYAGNFKGRAHRARPWLTAIRFFTDFSFLSETSVLG